MDRPPTAGGGPHAPGSERPPTASRPRTSNRPRSSRPTTGRPGTRSGGAGQGAMAAPFEARQYVDDWDEEEEEDYEDESDEDVFAFQPPGVGGASGSAPSTGQEPQLVASGSAYQMDPSMLGTEAELAAMGLTPQGTLAGPPPALPAQETFYYDEVTGALYDSAGRLIEMPEGFDPNTLIDGGRSAPPPNSDAAARTQTRDLKRLNTPTGSIASRALSRGGGNTTTFERIVDMSSEERNLLDNTPSTDSQKLPSQGGEQQRREGSSGNSSNRPQSGAGAGALNSLTQRDIGFAAGGGVSLDRRTPDRHVATPKSADSKGRRKSSNLGLDIDQHVDANGMRLRTNRLSQFADAGPSPVHEVKFHTDTDEGGYPFTSSYDVGMDTTFDAKDKGRSSSEAYLPQSFHMGDGQGLVHPALEGVEIGSRGLRMVELELELEEDSPYPEVRASVSNIDDPTLPAMTLRMWILGMFLTILASGANCFLNFRFRAPTLSPLLIILVAWPLGKLMAAVLPYRVFQAPRWMGGFKWSLNPGNFNIKEHSLIAVMANVSISQAYAINATIVQDSPVFYNQPRPILFNIFLVVSSQIIGFGLAGLTRRFLVYPASMVWPQNLVVTTILNTLHADDDGHDGTMTRFRYFYIVGAGAFVWYFVPGFLFQALSIFNWVCWIWPESLPVNTVFGVATGLGFSFLTFDWSQISFIGSPLVIPWWASCNIFAGFTIFIWIAAPILWFTDSMHMGHMPISSTRGFDRFAMPYQITSVIDATGTALDADLYESYSPLYLSTMYYLVFWAGFATASSVLVHTALYHGHSLWLGLRNVKTDEDDIHAKFMRYYREVPDWWYLLTIVVCVVLSVIAIEVYHTGLPIWGLVLAIIIPTVYMLPAGFIFAMTGQQLGTNLVSEFIAGYVLPGKPFANMLFKVYALQGLINGLSFIQDLKLGHYMKLPPRATFSVQVTGTFIAAIVQVGVKTWMLDNIELICTQDEPHNYTCPHAGVFYTSSIVWGMIGPHRLFGPGSAYSFMYWAILVGAVVPIPFWLYARRFPQSPLRYVSWPVIFSGSAYIPPGSGINYTAWFAVAFIFQYLLRRVNFRWWSKYNFVTAAALDSGTVVSVLVIFLTLILPRNGSISLNWWGNEIFINTLDAQGVPRLQTGPEGFAPAPNTPAAAAGR